MRITAQSVRPGDRVRGIGLTVAYSEPQDDFHTALIGQYSVRADGELSDREGQVILPNEHLVNVRRSDENFRADLEQRTRAAIDRLNDTSDFDEFVGELHRISAMPRHGGVTYDAAYDAAQAYAASEGEVGVAQLLEMLVGPTEDAA